MVQHLRAVDRSEAEEFIRCTFAAFGAVPTADTMQRTLERFDPEFAIGVVDQGRVVATASAYALEMTLPAAPGQVLPTLAVPGVTAVGVLPTHRRQGLLTRVMNHQLADLRGRGYALSVLLASESIIYGRFGYGAAQFGQSLVVERAHSAFRRDAGWSGADRNGAGRVRMVDPDEAAKVLPGVHEQARRLRPGELNRSALWWRWHLKDLEGGRDHGGARLYAVHESAQGEADGWVSYRYHEARDADLPRSRVEVDDLVATTPAVLAALWRLVLDLDLVETIGAGRRPMDEPLRWLLADLRQARTTDVVDHLWVRILDIPAALAARGYGASERLVLEVTSADPAAAGRFVLESGPESGTCRRARNGENTQLIVPLVELGAMYLGGVTPSVLSRSGLVTQCQPGVLAVADAVFSGPVAPHCSLHF